jgi:hypothetical protein
MLRKFLASREGNLSLVFAIAIVPIMVGVAGAVDLVLLNTRAAKLQDTLDASAMAIATRYYSGMSQAELEGLGRDFFASNITLLSSDGMESASTAAFDYLDAFSAEAEAIGNEDYIRVSSSFSQPGIVGSINWNVTRRSVVRVVPGDPACVLALDRTASSAIKIQGSTVVEMKGCRLASNSKANDAIYRGGSARISAECTSSVGGTSGLGSSSYVQMDCGAPLVNQYPAHDPLFNVVPPAYTGCKKSPGGKTITLSPGTYCNDTISGDVTLEPGIYILRGGSIKLGGNGRLVGKGVTIFLMEDASFDIGANQVVQLSPPSEGPYAGITIYQAKGNTSALNINGGAGSLVTGFVYSPSAHITYTGNSTTTGAGECLRIIGRTVEMNGNSNVALDCDKELGGKKIYAGRTMVLVK